jgi:hypothetical protein
VKLKKSEEKFERLKEHAEETLEKANREIENLTRSQVSDYPKEMLDDSGPEPGTDV